MKIPTIMLAGLLIVASMTTIALLAPLIASLVPHERSSEPFAPPNSRNILGTNDLGDDVFVEIIYGARLSMAIGFLAALIVVLIGLSVGVLAGYYHGSLIDEVLSTITDILLVIPVLPLAIVLTVYLEPSFWNVVLVIGLLWWPSTARVIRARVAQLRSMEFVSYLKSLGASDLYIILRHIIPNVIEILIARFILAVPKAILFEAGLAFLGLSNPNHLSWGLMLHYALTRGGLLRGAWWTFIPPGLCIAITALGFMLIGMSLEEKISGIKVIKVREL